MSTICGIIIMDKRSANNAFLPGNDKVSGANPAKMEVINTKIVVVAAMKTILAKNRSHGVPTNATT